MGRIRMAAAILSMMTTAVAVWAWAGGATWKVFVTLLVAAACLAVICPFDAPDPRRRTRVAIACLSYVLAIGAATVSAYLVTVSGMLMLAMLLLAETGVGLTGWTLATRNRSRMPRSSRYYEN